MQNQFGAAARLDSYDGPSSAGKILTAHNILKVKNTTAKFELFLFMAGVFGLAMPAVPVFGFTFGNIEVRSHLGENFDGFVNFSLSPGEEAEESCFKLATGEPSDDLAGLPSAVLSLNPMSGGGALRIRSRQPVNEPALKIALQTNCPGLGQLQREYVVLLDPPAPFVTAASSPAGNAGVPGDKSATARHALPKEGQEWLVNAGDSLAAVAQGAHPRDRKARQALIEAMIAANPQLAGYGPDDLLPPDSTLRIPRLSRVAQAEITKTPADEVAAVVAKPGPKPAQASARKNKPSRTATENREIFQLRLSTADIDLSRSEKMTEEERVQLREKQLLLDADDQVANLLALKNSIKQLESRLAGLQAQIATPPVKTVVKSPTPSIPPAATPSRGAITSTVRDSQSFPQDTVVEWLAAHWYWWLLPILAMLLLWMVKRQRREALPSAADYRVYAKTRQMERSRQVQPKDGLVDLDFHVGDIPPAGSTPWSDTRTDPRVIYRDVIVSQFPELQAAGNTEPETLIAVAWKYFEDHRERGRAVELVEFGLDEHPDAEELWMTQFEFLRRDVRRSAYEQLAKRYLQRFPKGPTWVKIQTGGRFLEPDNLLYMGVNEDSGMPLDLDLDITGADNSKPAVGSVPGKTTVRPEVPVDDLATPLDFTPSSHEEQAAIQTRRPLKR